RMMLVADRAPGDIDDIDDRLRSRFEGGLMLEITSGKAVELQLVEPAAAAAGDRIFVPDFEEKGAKGSEGRRRLEPVAAVPADPPAKGGAWFPSPENVVIHWPRLDELLIEELD
ncbi:MAG TPA: DnaA/Hda family protein, partial [Longimicrobiales bacterium]|nr:DnaA/Hda family protein [Longimicrobiales bacterium]